MSSSDTSVTSREAAQPLILIVSAPSGTGKSTLIRRVMAARSDLSLSISHTTRPPRPGEADGTHYYFVSPEEFAELRDADKFAEHADVFDRCYGTSKAEIQRIRSGGCHVVLDIDYQGAQQLVENYPDAVSIFILPPSLRALATRLRGRHTESEAAITTRLSKAQLEIQHAGSYKHVVVNDEVDRAVDQLEAIIEAELTRTPRMRPVIDALLAEPMPE